MKQLRRGHAKKVAAPKRQSPVALMRRGVSPAVRQSVRAASTEFEAVVWLIEAARWQASRAVNVQLIDLYWKIGDVISRRIPSDGWGRSTVEELSAHLSRTQRGTRGVSPQNLWRMRQFFEAYRDAP